MLNQMIKYILFPISFSLLVLGCGPQQTEESSFDANRYIKSVDLNRDTVALDVELAITPQDFLNSSKGIAQASLSAPIDFQSIKKIWLFTHTSGGERKLLGVSSTHETAQKQTRQIDVIDFLQTQDRIWISDIKNSQQFIANVQFLNSPGIVVTVDFKTNGSISLGEMDGFLPNILKVYLNFERK